MHWDSIVVHQMSDALSSLCTYVCVKDKKVVWLSNSDPKCYGKSLLTFFLFWNLKNKSFTSYKVKTKTNRGTSLMYQATKPKTWHQGHSSAQTLLTHICMRYAPLPQGCTSHNGNIARGFLKELKQGIQCHFNSLYKDIYVLFLRWWVGRSELIHSNNGWSFTE